MQQELQCQATATDGRIQTDGVWWYNDDKIKFSNGTEIRHTRIYLQDKFYNDCNDWQYKLQYDFLDSGAKGIRDAYLAYTGLQRVKLKAANYVKVLRVSGGRHDGDTPDRVQGRVQVAF